MNSSDALVGDVAAPPRGLNRWWIVFAGFLGHATASGMFTVFAFGVFAPSMSKDLGFAPSVLALSIVLYLAVNGLSTVALGRLISRFGVKRPSIVMVALYGATIIALPLLPAEPSLFYINFAIMGAVTGAVCGMPYIVAICGFFDRSRGLALGIAVLGGGVGATASPLLADALLNAFGWRLAITIYGLGSVSLALIALIFFTRTPPGVVLPKGAQGRGPAQAGISYWKDAAFWIIAIGITGNAVAGMGILINLIAMMAEQGIPRGIAATILSTAGLASLGGRLLTGWCLDRFFAPRVATVIFAAGAVGVLILVYGEPGPQLYAAAVLLGVCIGAEGDLLSFLVSRYFGRAQFSRVIGILWVAWSWGGAMGSFLVNASLNWTNSYEPALWLFISGLAVAAIVVNFLPQYRFPHSSVRRPDGRQLENS